MVGRRLMAGCMILLLVYFVRLAARHRKNWPRWALAAMLVLSVISLVQVIGERGLEIDSAIEIVSCVLTTAGLYSSFTGDAQGWFNAWAWRPPQARMKTTPAKGVAAAAASTGNVTRQALSANSCRRPPLRPPQSPRATVEIRNLPYMEWTDEGIVLGVRRHGESSAIVELLTREHRPSSRPGARRRQLADAPAATARQQRQPRCGGRGSTSISACMRWRAPRLRAATLLASSHRGLRRHASRRRWRGCCRSAIRTTTSTRCWSGRSTISRTPALPPCIVIRFELAMLTELGFGLDLENCAATGTTTDLIYVSPKSGGARVARRGEPWRDRPVAAAGVPARRRGRQQPGRTRICSTASRSPACSCSATCWSRAARATPMPATDLSTP